MKFLIGALLCLASSTLSVAQVAEVRAGIGVHDLRVIGNQPVRERSVVLNGEILFEEPEFLKWALSPQPYIGGQLNLERHTSFGGAGLVWRQNFGKQLYSDLAVGFVIHDGTLGIVLPSVDLDGLSIEETRAIFRERFILSESLRNTTIEYGSRVLIREQLTLGYLMNANWAIEGYFEHVSHGNFWTDAENDGSDSAGFRINRIF